MTATTNDPFAPSFTHEAARCQSRETLWQGFFRIERLTLSHRLFAGGWSQPLQRELFVRGDAVGVLLLDVQRKEVVMLEQFRVGALAAERSPWLLELVAGMIEPGETPEVVARRECREEAGCEPLKLIPITRYYSSPGGSDEQIHLFCGLVDAGGLGGIHGLDHENEDIRVLRVPLLRVEQALRDGRIDNAMTLIALQWMLLNPWLIAEETVEYT